VSIITHLSVLKKCYSWFDTVKLAKVLTGIHESAGFPGMEELFSACCQWLSCNAFTLGHFWCHCCIPWPWKCKFWCHICHTFDIMDHLIMRYCVDVGHLGKWCRVRIAHTADDVVTQFRDPHTPMINLRHADKCLYSAANYSKTRAFFRPLMQHYNRKWPTGNQMVTWPMTSRDPKGQVHDPNTVRAQYLENSWRCYLATIANY